ncbi:MAG: hypothetical protein LBT59_23690, partial [Clostridiales bacterium]|nr:hypothetical protein [Clostridiales bacterium]
MFTVRNGVLTGYKPSPEKLDVVVLPEGIKVLRCRSLEKFACKKLVMPSTLEVIDELAFLSADISVLDFADCK